MNKQVELLLCPFCGSEAKLFSPVNDTDDNGWAIVCQQPDCECNIRLLYCYSKEEAIKQWNHRVGGQAPRPDVSDRLEEIKRELIRFGNIRDSRKIHWLIDELEKCRAENKELNRLFDLQHTRMKRAEHLWQQATGKHDTMPDLGVLLDWLMGEVKRSEQLINDWRGAVSNETDRGMEWKERALKAEAELKEVE